MSCCCKSARLLLTYKSAMNSVHRVFTCWSLAEQRSTFSGVLAAGGTWCQLLLLGGTGAGGLVPATRWSAWSAPPVWCQQPQNWCNGHIISWIPGVGCQGWPVGWWCSSYCALVHSQKLGSSNLVSGERACIKGAVVIKSAVLSVNFDSRKIRIN